MGRRGSGGSGRGSDGGSGSEALRRKVMGLSLTGVGEANGPAPGWGALC